jgi:hypothetical protein
VSELDEGVNGDEVEGDLDLRDEDEHVEEKEGSVYDEVEDRGRRECPRFGNGSVERPASTSLSKEKGMRTAMRSKGSLLLLPVGDMLVPPNDSDELECEVGVASASALALHFHIQKKWSRHVLDTQAKSPSVAQTQVIVVLSLFENRIQE